MNHPQKPEIYQGFGQKKRYFEGWYFKHVTADQSFSLALIPGISLSKKDPHAFVQAFLVYQGEKPHLDYHYFRFPNSDFSADKKKFHVQVGTNTFSFNHSHIDLKNEDVHLCGDFNYQGRVPLPKNIVNPSIMGPFAYLPAMECYHGVLSLQHSMTGSLTVNDEVIDFTNGKGYLEKDWGRSFPENYVWVQANHFQEDNVSFFFSYAKIPYLGLKFLGLISHVYLAGQHYRFATYNGAKVLQEVLTQNSGHYVIKKGSLTLEFEATIDRVASLKSPKLGTMDHQIKEGLSGRVSLRLKKGKRLMYEGVSSSAGIEFMR